MEPVRINVARWGQTCMFYSYPLPYFADRYGKEKFGVQEINFGGAQYHYHQVTLPYSD